MGLVLGLVVISFNLSVRGLRRDDASVSSLTR